MIGVDFWVEGEADQKFLSDLLNKWFTLSFNSKFECKDDERKLNLRIRYGKGVSSFTSKGWNNIKPSFLENLHGEPKIKNIIIADADHSFDSRVDEITQTVTEVEFDPQSDLYLWPNNQENSEKGDLERLLLQITQDNHQEVLTCFDSFEKCLSSIPEKNYTIPDLKRKIFVYSEVVSGNGNEKIRDYTKEEYWNLDHEQPILKPLYGFLKKHLNL